MLLKNQKELSEEISSEMDSNFINVIYGKPGSGKTYLLKTLEDSLYITFDCTDKNGTGIQSIISQTYAFEDCIQKETLFDLINKEANLSLKFIINFIKTISNDLKKKIKRFNNFFSVEEMNVLLSILKNCKKHKYLILDHIDNTNTDQFQFIKKILNKDVLNELFHSNSYNIKIIICCNTIEMKDILANINGIKLINTEINEKIYNDFLENKKVSKEYYSLLGNLLEYNLTNTLDILNLIDSTSLNLISKNDYLENKEKLYIKLKEILYNESKYTTDDLTLMEIASIIGLIFTEKDLEILSEKDNYTIDNIIKKFTNTSILQIIEENKFEFVYCLIKEILYDKCNEKCKYHKRYAETIKKTHPNNYKLIANNYKLAKEPEKEIETLAIKYTLSKILSCVSTDNDEIKSYIQNNDFMTFLSKILIKYCNKDFENCVEKINIFNTNATYQVYILKYIKARCYINGYNIREYFVEAIKLLDNCCHYFYKNEYIEIYCDCAILIVNTYCYKLSMYEESRKRYEYYNLSLLELCKNDKTKLNISTFQRRTASVLDSEIALEKLINLYKQNNYNVIENYKLLNDISGYCLYTGNYSKANDYIAKAYELIDTLNYVNYPDTFKLENNRIILNVISSVDNEEKFNESVLNGIKCFEKYLIISSISNIILLNHASLLVLAKNIDKAIEEYLNLLEKTKNYNNALYSTYINSNLSYCYLFKEDYDKAKLYCSKAEESISLWGEPFKNDYIEHNKILKLYIENKHMISPFEAFFSWSPNTNLEHTQKFTMRGILVSELLFYME